MHMAIAVMRGGGRAYLAAIAHRHRRKVLLRFAPLVLQDHAGGCERHDDTGLTAFWFLSLAVSRSVSGSHLDGGFVLAVARDAKAPDRSIYAEVECAAGIL